ncbi:hypothetical protein XELAEV_18025311mg [Xenopus laevis]|uniref:Uncharacterized protein n=1 Tax=Xenopus laevis TaxID=8355 RepID=A0A974D0F9_XENLA|nr:hypothetical protein XELAEV_18025311mg [Xenopus laevis]
MPACFHEALSLVQVMYMQIDAILCKSGLWLQTNLHLVVCHWSLVLHLPPVQPMQAPNISPVARSNLTLNSILSGWIQFTIIIIMNNFFVCLAYTGLSETFCSY